MGIIIIAGITAKIQIANNVKFYLKNVFIAQVFLYLILMELFELIVLLKGILCCCC